MDFTAANNMALYQAAVVGALVLACLLETLAPARPASPTSLWRWLNNLLLALLNHVLLLAAMPLLYLVLMQWLPLQEVGLLRRWDLHPVLAFGVLFFSLEGVGYAMHRAWHAVPLLWRVHAVHHSDTEVDFSTAHRHHPLEVVVMACVTLPVVVVLGPDVRVLLAYQVLTVLVVALSHANVNFGPRINQMLKWLVVTPEFHRVHHSAEQRYTNSHYGTVSPLFDHLFGTAVPLSEAPDQQAALGLEYFREPHYARVDRMLAVPFAWRKKE